MAQKVGFLCKENESFQVPTSKEYEAYEILISVHLPFPYSTQHFLSLMASFKPEGHKAQRNKVPTSFMEIES